MHNEHNDLGMTTVKERENESGKREELTYKRAHTHTHQGFINT